MKKKELTEWHSIVTRSKTAELCEKYLSKGDKVYIEGQNRTRKWTDNQGVERYTTEVHARNITFLSTKRRESGESSVGSNQQVPKDTNDDLPF